jgi:soluble lytic murein transglycosylase-like protein
VPLTGPLTHMSEALVEAANKLPDLGKAITTLGGWIDWLSGKIAHIDQVFKDIGHAVNPSNYIAPGQNSNSLGRMVSHSLLGLMPSAWGADKNLKNYTKYLADLDKEYRLPAGTLEFLKKQESGASMDPNITNKASHATGLFQFMPETANRYGTIANDPIDSAIGAGSYFRDLLTKYHGDIRKALAAYNGAANLDALIAAHPKDWLSYTKPETQNYVGNYDKATASGRIIIEDRTGGNVTISLAALGAPSP